MLGMSGQRALISSRTDTSDMHFWLKRAESYPRLPVNPAGANLPISENQGNTESEFAGLKDRSIDGAAATAGGQGVKFVLQFLSQIWLARLISPAEYGLIAMVAPILSFIGIIGDMGIGMALVQQKSISQSQTSALFWLNAMLSLIICVGLIVVSPLVGLLYHEPKTVCITIALAVLFFVSTFG